MMLDCCTKLGPYDILPQLRKGGIEEVYKAGGPPLDRIVAVKVLLPIGRCRYAAPL